MPKTKKTYANHTILSMSSLFTRGSLFIFLFLILIPLFSQASINPQISYQGKLNDASGNIVSDGSYNMVFKIYDTASGGVPLWTGNYTAANGNPVSVSSGVFSILLGSGTGNSLNLDFSATAYYLGVTVGPDPEMTPRKRIGSVPQAYNANNLIGDGYIKITGLPTGTQVGEGTVYINPSSAASTYTLLGAAVNGSQKMKLDASGNLTVEGNVGIGQTSPTAYLHLKAGTATANTAPIKLTSGTNLTTPEAGALEFNGTDLFFTPSTTRETIAFISDLTGASHNAVTLAGTYDYLALAGQEITLNQIDLATDITGILPIANGGTGANTLNDLIALTTHTTGNYVASITNGSGISGGNGGSEGAALTLSLGALTADWNQTGAFDIVLANASSELKIMGSGGTYYGIFDVGNITGSNKTYTFPDASGTVALTSDLHSAVTLAGENYLSLSGQQITANTINLAGTNVNGILPLANGGTNANFTAVQGGIVYSGASALAISAAGTTGQALISGGTGVPTWTTGTLTLGGNLNTANAFITSGNYSLTLTTTGTTNVTLPTSGTLATTSQVVSDHGGLTGLTDDDHSIYALLTGRSGGQTLIGGTAASENLTLQSTSNATKGKILFGTSAYDEANNRLGIGTTSPAYKLDVSGSGQFTGTPAGSGVSQGTLYINPSTLSTTPTVQWTAQSSWNTPDVGTDATPVLADLDNDGDYDLMIGAYDGISYAYENTGSSISPVWTAKPAWNAPDLGYYSSPAFADLDNDGDYDLMIGEYNAVSYAYENTGSSISPVWTAKPAWNAPAVGGIQNQATPAFADLDNDGDYDLMIGTYNGVSYAFENTGSSTSPAWTAKSAWNAPDVGTLSQPDLADLDSDGDYDLLIGEGGGIGYAYENTGSVSNPTWNAKSTWNTPAVSSYSSPAFADMDNDGDYDLLIGDGTIGASYAYKNTGSGGATGNTLLGIAVNGSEKFRVNGLGGITANGLLDLNSYLDLDYNGTSAAASITQSGTGDILNIFDGSTEVLTVLDGGNVGIGDTSPSAYLQIKAGTATTGTAPIKLTSGTNLTTPEAGAIEFDGTDLFFTPSTTRETIAFISDVTAASHSAVTLAGSYDYLTLSGQQITLNQIDLTTDVTGILPAAKGGTGTSTQFTQGSIVFAGASGVYSQDNSNFFWDDTNNRLGIGTTSPSNILSLGNAQAQKIWIENTANTVAGRSLTVAAGSTVSYGAVRFVALGQTSRIWYAMAAAPNGNVYAAVASGDIYMQTGGTGNFVALGQTARNWNGMTAAPNGNVYASANVGDIYMQTGGTGNFVALGQTNRAWQGMAAAPNGNVYAAVQGGDIYMQTGGTGNFVALGQTSRSWAGMAAAPNGNVYAAVQGGDIYMQTGGTGNFVALGQTSRNWYGMAAAPNGDVYAVVTGGDIYMQTGGTGNFVALGQTSRNWIGMAAAPIGDIYAAVVSGDIYMQTASGGTADLAGGNLILSSGVGKGTGASSISFFTGTTLTTGNTSQTLSEKMTILGNGNVGIGAAIPGAKLDVRGGINAGTNGTEFAISTAGLITTASVNSASIVDNSITGADIALGSDAQGDIMYYNGTDWARLTAGTSGYFLKTQGAAADPIWAAASAGVTDHGALTGLLDDDHTQYAILAGRSGGQTLIGGTGTIDDLILRTTSGVGASGADMIFQVGSNGGTEAMRILNSGYVGIGTTTPSTGLTVATIPTGSGVSQGTLYVNPAQMSSAAIVSWSAKTAWNAPDVGISSKPAFADLDNDGDYDLLIGSNDGFSYAYENTGTVTSPIWTAKTAWNVPDVGVYSAPIFADLDNDGDYDLLIGAQSNGCFAYENTGTVSSPVWTTKSAWDIGAGFGYIDSVPAFADLDNDGDYDLLIGEYSTGISFAYENTGTVSSPIWTAKTVWNAPDVGQYASPAFADLDNDGDFDLFIGEQNGISYGYENTGTVSSPIWTAKTAWNTLDVGLFAHPAFADINNDGDHDLLIGEDGGISYAYENTGSGGATGNTLLGLAVNGSEKLRVTGAGAINAQGYITSQSYGSFTYNGDLAALTVRQNGAGNILDLKDGATTIFTVKNGGNVGIGTTSPGSALDVKGTLRLSGSTSGYVGLAPAAAAGSTTYTLPSADGTSGQVLSTNGSGALSWTTAGGSLGWSNLTNPSANLALTMGAYTSTFTYNAATGANNLFNLTDTASNTGTGYLLNVTTATGSTLKPFHVSAAGTEALTVLANGNVGIGTTSPTALLHLNGSAGKVSLEINSNETTAASNVLMLRSDVTSADDPIFRVQANGAVFADGAYTGTGADYAEYFATKDTDLKSGEAVCVDTQKDNAVKRCARSGDNDIMGVVSSHPSIVGNSADGREKDPNYKVIAMLGQIAGNVSGENGSIQIGDSLTSANTPGYLRKADAGESTVGVALQKFDGKQGSIQMLISRRNKSLTVEKVEEAVTQRIADMNVQDQVDKMIADATTELARNTETQLIDMGGRVVTLETLVNGYETRIKLQEDLAAILQAQIDELKQLANQELNVAQIDANTNDIDYLKLVLGLDGNENPGDVLLSGQLEAEGIVAGAFTVKITDPEAKTIGEAIICPAMKVLGDDNNCDVEQKDEDGDKKDDTTGDSISDGKSVIVKTKAVKEDSRILATPIGKEPVIWIISEVNKEEGFTISIDKAMDNDVKFNWWVIEEK